MLFRAVLFLVTLTNGALAQVAQPPAFTAMRAKMDAVFQKTLNRTSSQPGPQCWVAAAKMDLDLLISFPNGDVASRRMSGPHNLTLKECLEFAQRTDHWTGAEFRDASGSDGSAYYIFFFKDDETSEPIDWRGTPEYVRSRINDGNQ